jgi:hydrogenase maturation protein HypF
VVAVQHHHAHVAACLVDHGRDERVLGIAFDGFGLGDDGTMWGGELLVADLRGYRRAGHLLQVPLPGGDAAAREPWRMATSWLLAATDADRALHWAAAHDRQAGAVLDIATRAGTVAPMTSSAGRLFDAVAALLGLRDRVTFEGQAAIELEAAARRHRGAPTHLPRVEILDSNGQIILDPRATVAALVNRAASDSTAALAAAFHAALAHAVVGAATRICNREGLDTVALTGGVFQNATLTGLLAPALRRAGLAVLVHRDVPPNDGGISIGQAAVAAQR